MFDFAFSEIALVGIVALLVIGPKDMPVAIKAVAGAIKKARRMAGEFQGHVDEMMREADLHEVRDTINDLRSMDIKNRIISAVDGDGTIRRALDEDPLKIPLPAVAHAPPPDLGSAGSGSAEPGGTAPPALRTDLLTSFPSGQAPSFVPPAAAAAPPAPASPPSPAPPAFIPPGAALPPA
jgi:sec-independent protein translocase protein TatB